MRKVLLVMAAGALIAGASCTHGTDHVVPTTAKTSAPVATVSSGTDTMAIEADLNGVDQDLANVDGSLSQAGSDLANTNEGDVQR
jgi:hypothetical protein